MSESSVTWSCVSGSSVSWSSVLDSMSGVSENSQECSVAGSIVSEFSGNRIQCVRIQYVRD